MTKSAVATLVDRRSRYLRLTHLPDGHRADQLVTALEAALVSMSADKRRWCYRSSRANAQ
jgi:IS30 family transposase